MQAVILAGGLGTRLRPLTNTCPKPMVPILDKPYLHYQLAYLQEQSIKRILLLTGYLGEQVEEYFKDGTQMSLEIHYSKEPEPLGTGGALRYAKNLLDDQFFLLNGDSFLPLHFADLQKQFEESQRKGMVVIYPNDEKKTGVISNITINQNLLVTQYNKSNDTKTAKYVDAGITIFNKSILDLIPKQEDKKKVSLEQEIYSLLITQQELGAYVTTQRFYDIGRPERLKEFEEFLTHEADRK